ncbi:two-component regulator propeller domain-containing protein [Paraflavitalea speifideaquila]|uniref:two-component regulator propeller domain-containing protein n=1 Tax=Paraflavitalea speifideaquila TaxID=3076558 RepID=UPI0028E50CD2|nr:two-component regulator propeller domain-containing protein [Paraflavitalea speifideiaquila]
MKDLSLLMSGLLACSCLRAADTLQYALRHYTDENGLPQNSIKFIAPDKKGFVWLATENGLVRFDGQRFRVFNKSNLALASSRIYTIMPGNEVDNLYTINEVGQVVYVQNGEARLDSSHIQQASWSTLHSKDGRFHIYPASGLPNLYKNFISFDGYAIPINNQDYFLVTGQVVSLYKNKKRLFLTDFRHADFWRFSTWAVPCIM